MSIVGKNLAIGVDVGGTFTKAVAVERNGSLEPVASKSVPTTHRSENGVADGVIASLLGVIEALGDAVSDLELVSISTTQAVNALLEGDTAKVGILAIGKPQHARKARKRTRIKSLEIAPGKRLDTCHEVVLVNGQDLGQQFELAIDNLLTEGAQAIAISQAFGVDDPTLEELALELCRKRDIPACAGHQLSRLYGLELRTQTAAINASILPVMRHTARMTGQALREAGIHTPQLVMRGDGGSTPLKQLELEPIRTLFSGPAASVAGAQKLSADTQNGLIIEHGGTSTNIAAIIDGQPLSDYVRVMNFSTCVRALDVRVIGIAGGSLMRQEKPGRYALGPRSAHQAGLEYSCFSEPLVDPVVELISPQPDDPPKYLLAKESSGRRVAVTPTCCAVALGRLKSGDQAAAQTALTAIGAYMGKGWQEVAEEALEGGSRAILDLAQPLLSRYPQAKERVVSAGGAAQVFGPTIAQLLGAEGSYAPHSSVLSSIGSALSLMRYEVEKNLTANDDAHHRAVEQEAVELVKAQLERDGADVNSINVRLEHDRERGTVRAIASGSLDHSKKLSTVS